MANYGTKYRLDWESRTAPCRVDLQKDGYSSGVQVLTPATAPLTIRWGEPERPDLTRALMQSEATVRFRGDSTGEAVSEVFDAPDRAWRVVFQRDTGAGLEDEWYGFLKTDEWRDNQRRDSDIVELAAIGGLQLLQNVDYDLAGTDVYSALRTIMRGVHSFNVATNCEWYPYRGGNQIPASSLPLSNLTIGGQAFDEIEKIEGEKGFKTTGRRDRHRVLEAILERFGMRAFQSRGEWIARQRTQIQSTGEIKEWPNSTAVANNNPTTRDLTRSLPTPFQTDQPRGLVRRLRNAESAHTYNNLGQLVRNSGFEVGDGSKTGWSGGGFVQNYDNTRVLKNSTQENTYVLHLENDTTSPFAGDKITQDVPAIIHDPGPTGAIEFEWLVSQKENDEGNPTLITGISLGSDYYAQQQGVDVDGKTEAAEDGTLAISNPIPGQNGAVIIPQGGFLYTPPLIDAPRLEVLSPVREGDTEINARIPTDIPDGANLTYYTWSTKTLSFDPGPNRPDINYRGFLEGTNGNPIDGDTMAQQKIVMPLNAPDGTRLAERGLSFEFKTQIIDTLLDDVTARLLKGGEPVGETSFIAQDDQAGEEISITQFIGDGPTFDHPRSLSLSGVEVTQDWKVGAYSSGASRSDQLIEEVTAEAAHRQQRETAQRFTENVPLVGSDEIWPHDVFSINGALYSVTFLERTFSQEESVQAELTELKDAGTSGLTRTFEMNTEGGGGGSGTSSVIPRGGSSSSNDAGATGIEVIQLDATGGNVTETLPAPSEGTAKLALRVDDNQNNIATLKTSGSQEIRFPEGKEVFSTTLGVEQSLLLSSDGNNWYVEEGQGLSAEAEAVTTDAGTKDSPSLTQTATYDSDGTTSVTSSDVSIERYVRTDNSGNATLVYESGGTEIARLSSEGRFETRKDQEAFMDGSLNSGQGTNSLLQFEDAKNNRSTTDLAKLTVKGSGVTVTNPSTDEYVLDISGGGSGSGSATDVLDNGTEVVAAATDINFGGGDFDVSQNANNASRTDVTLTNDSVTVAGNNVSLGGSTGIGHSDLSGISSDDHHPKTTSASDLTDVSADSASNAHHNQDQSANYKDGGSFEVDAAEFAAGLGTNGQVLQSDGAAASWATLSAGDVSGISAHTRPSAGDGLSDSSNTFSVNESQVDHDSLNQFVANEHIDHSAVTISAGTALSGGGDLTLSRTLNVSGPLTGIPFKNSGDSLEWQADANNDLILQNTTDAQTLLKVDQDTGTVFAAGDVVAFGLSGGGGSGSTSGLQADAPLALDTSTDPDTIGLSVGSGLTVNSGTLEADGSVGVSSVFGRTGDVTASSGDYSASQISGFDEKAQDAVGTIMAGSGAASVTYDDAGNTITISATDTDTQLSDSEVQTAINNDTDHGSTASHNYTTSASDLTDVSPDSDSDAHHTQPSTGDGLTGSTTFKVDSTVARTNAKDVFEDQIRIDGPLPGSDNTIGGNSDFVLALGGKPYGVDDADGTGDNRLGDGLLQTAHGKASDYRTYLEGGHGRVAHTWNAYYDSGASTWRSVVGSEPHTLVGIGNTSPGNVNGGGVTLATTGSSTSAEDAITWNVGVHVDVDGKVGIGDITDPSHALQVGGDMRATGEVEAFLGSDRRLKTDLDPLGSALDKVDQLTGYGFDWREGEAVQPHKRGETDVGLIAQEVEDVLPEAVREFQDGHSEGYKSVSYDKIVPLLIEAIKDLRSQIEQLQ